MRRFKTAETLQRICLSPVTRAVIAPSLSSIRSGHIFTVVADERCSGNPVHPLQVVQKRRFLAPSRLTSAISSIPDAFTDCENEKGEFCGAEVACSAVKSRLWDHEKAVRAKRNAKKVSWLDGIRTNSKEEQSGIPGLLNRINN